MLAAGWVVDENGALRRETIHHMGRRLPGWDYRRRGYYVITIVLENRRSGALGELRVRSGGEWVSVGEAKGLGLEPDQVEAKVVYSELGRAIFDHFRKMGEFTPGLEPVYCAVMPDHLYLLLKVERELKRPLGNAIGGFKTGCEKIYARFGGEGRLFAEGFVDHVILRGGQLAVEFNYLRDNPRRLAVKRLFPELFRVSRRVGVALRGLGNQQLALLEHDRHEASQGQDRQGAGEGTALEGAVVSGAPAARAVGYFSALGNHFLLDRPLAQVQVSRRFFGYRRLNGRIARDEKGEPLVDFSTPEYEARRDELFAAARHGAVLISPCISDGERQIAREALAAGVPLVTMANKGFAPLQKPSGRLFDACSDGRLLMLAPAAWPYLPGEKPVTRSDATAMNRLCQWLAGEGAAEINYRGLLPANIDALAKAAAQIA